MKQPEALRLADELEEPIPKYPAPTALESAAAAELRRLYEANQAMLEALKKISRTEYHIETPPIESLEEKMRQIARAAIAKGEQS